MVRKRKEAVAEVPEQSVAKIANDLAAEQAQSGEQKPVAASQDSEAEPELFTLAVERWQVKPDGAAVPLPDAPVAAVADSGANLAPKASEAPVVAEPAATPASEEKPEEAPQDKLVRLEKTLLIRCKQEMFLRTLTKEIRDSKRKCEEAISETMAQIRAEKHMPLLQQMFELDGKSYTVLGNGTTGDQA